MDLATQLAVLQSGTDAASQNFGTASFTSGRIVVVQANVFNLADSFTGIDISDDQGHTWTELLDIDHAGNGVLNGGRSGLWWTTATVTGNVTITVTPAGQNAIRWCGACLEVNGGGSIGSTSGTDYKSATGAGLTPEVVLDATPAADAQVLVFGCVGRDDKDLLPGTGHTQISEVASNGGSNNLDMIATADLDNASATCNFSWDSGGGNWTIMAVVVPLAGGAPAATRPAGINRGLINNGLINGGLIR